MSSAWLAGRPATGRWKWRASWRPRPPMSRFPPGPTCGLRFSTIPRSTTPVTSVRFASSLSDDVLASSPDERNCSHPGRTSIGRLSIRFSSKNLDRRALERALDHPRQGFELERFLQCRTVAIFFRKARGAIAGREDERAIARLDQFGDRRNHLAVDVDVENGEVELGALRQPDRLVDLAGLGGHAVAELLQHVRDHHPDHHLVLDEEHRTARRPRRSHDNVLARPKPQGSQITPIGAMSTCEHATWLAAIAPWRGREQD